MNDEFQRVIREGLGVLDQAKKLLAQKKFKWQSLSSAQEGALAFQGTAAGGWFVTVIGESEKLCNGTATHEGKIVVLHGEAGAFFKAAVMATASPKRT